MASRVFPRMTPDKLVNSSYDLIETDGWVQVRQKGSHRQFHHLTKPGTVTVSGKLNIEVPLGKLISALKQAGLR